MTAKPNVLQRPEGRNHKLSNSDQHREYLLAELRSARLKSQLWTNHLDTIGIALKAKLITPEQAAGELKEGGYWGELIVDGLR
jgi:hypothetical protein